MPLWKSYEGMIIKSNILNRQILSRTITNRFSKRFEFRTSIFYPTFKFKMTKVRICTRRQTLTNAIVPNLRLHEKIDFERY